MILDEMVRSGIIVMMLVTLLFTLTVGCGEADVEEGAGEDVAENGSDLGMITIGTASMGGNFFSTW